MILEIVGDGAEEAAKNLFATGELQGSWEVPDDIEREGTLVTIATIVGIVGGSLTIAEKLYKWKQHCTKPESNIKIEKVLLIGDNNRRLLLKEATLDQLKELLDE